MNDDPTLDQSMPAKEKMQVELSKIFNELLGQRIREGIHAVYANYANFEPSDLDVKIVFGQLNQHSGNRTVDWHTAVTMAWAEAKMLSYFLRVNLAIYEAQQGTVKVPVSMLPSTIVSPDDIEDNPVSKKIFDTVQAIRTELMDEQLSLHKRSGESE